MTNEAEAQPLPRLLNEREVARLLGVSTMTVLRMRRDGTGPAFVRVGPRFVRYNLADVEQWLGEHRSQGRAA